MSFSDLVRKYDVQAPRYTSYPTVPYWDATPTSEAWVESIRTTLAGTGDRGWAFLRNACMAFDQRQRARQPDTRLFSRAL